MQIRALAWPAVLVSLVAQSASLGMMDSKTPLKVLVIGSMCNLVGDIALCSFLGYGIAGAAWATIASQVRSNFCRCVQNIFFSFFMNCLSKYTCYSRFITPFNFFKM